ncbi:MAG: YcxB family protein [bacterium]
MFEAELNRTAGDFARYRKVQRRVHHRTVEIVCGVIWVLGALLLVAVSVLATVLDFWDSSMVLWAAVFLALLVLDACLDWIIGFLGAKLQLKGGLHIVFDEEEIRVTAEKLREQYPYSGITELYYHKGTWYLFLDKNHAILLPERSLTSGDPAQFGAFLSQKCGKPIQTL